MKLGPQDAEQNFFGFVSSGLDFGDFLLAFAPKPVKMMTALRDFFPIEGARATFAETARVFRAAGAEGQVDMFEYDDTHGWSKPRREATYRWFERVLHGRDDDGLEREAKVDPPSALQVTATGQVATEPGGPAATVQSLNAALAETLHSRRAALAPGADLAGLVRKRLRVGQAVAAARSQALGEVDRDGYRIERILFQTEPGITVPGLLFVPVRGARGGVTIWLDPRGKAFGAEPGGAIENRVLGQAETILALDVRGWGESAPPGSPRSGYGAWYQTFMRAYLLGRSIIGMQAEDVLAVAARMRARFPDVRLHGMQPAGGALALYAGVLDPAVGGVSTETPVEPYLSMARRTVHDGLMDIFVHGVLADFDLPDLEKQLGARYAREGR
jgi:hypothetical protein